MTSVFKQNNNKLCEAIILRYGHLPQTQMQLYDLSPLYFI